MPLAVPVDPSNCGECDTCCNLFNAVKSFTKFKNGSPVTVSCSKLYWNCKCPGNVPLKLQRFISGTWQDLPGFSPASNYWFPPPSGVDRLYRLQCTLGSTVYYSNTVTVPAAQWQCDCDDLGTLKRIRIDIHYQFYSQDCYTSTPGSPVARTLSFYPGTGGNYLSEGFPTISTSIGRRMFFESPNYVRVDITGGAILTGARTCYECMSNSTSSWRLDLGDGDPCSQVAPCLADNLQIISSTGDQIYYASSWFWNGASWQGGCYYSPLSWWGGYSTIDSIETVLETCV